MAPSGNVYCDNLAGVREHDIAGLSLNELNKAAAAVSVVDSTESS